MQRRKSAKVCSHFCVLCRTIFFAPNTVWHKWQPSNFHSGTIPFRQKEINIVNWQAKAIRISCWHHSGDILIPYPLITPREEILSVSPLLVLYHDLLTEGEMHFMKEKVQCWLEMGVLVKKNSWYDQVELPDVNSQVSSQMNPATVQDLTNNAGKVPISKKSWIHMRTIFNNTHVFLSNQYSNI